jgi:hypothetical protein
MRQIYLTLLCIAGYWICAPLGGADTPAGLVERLGQTRAVNIDAIIETQFSDPEHASGFTVADPYGEKAAATVHAWQADARHETVVCAVRFSDAEQVAYELRGFANPGAAAAAGFTVTHQGRCGSCSTLKDLAVYLSTPDLTTPARRCSRRFGMQGKKGCFEKEIGFTPYCAESWAYNASQTRKRCLGVCVGDYGFFNLLFHRYPGGNVNASGQLRPCLQCDEDNSGPGFKYSAGRTRRNSGIESAIPRADSELYPVDHSAYFH